MSEKNHKITDNAAVKAVSGGIEKVTKIKFITEFREFISRGNVLDMAVGMIVGSAFTAIVTALVNSVLMPALGMITGGIDFSDLKWVLKPEVLDAAGEVVEAEVAIGYGVFIGAVINFLLIALSVFIFVKVLGKLKRKKVEEAAAAPAPEPEPDPQLVLLTEIRDLLKDKNTDNKV